MKYFLRATDRIDDGRSSIESPDKDELPVVRGPWTLEDTDDLDWLFDMQAIDVCSGAEYLDDDEKSAIPFARRPRG